MPSAQALKIPPHDEETEKSVLGAVLIDSGAMNLVAETLKIDHFYLQEHKLIYTAMLTLFEKQQPIDLVTLKNELHSQGNLKKVGGMTFLSDLLNVVPTSAYIEHYAQIVK